MIIFSKHDLCLCARWRVAPAWGQGISPNSTYRRASDIAAVGTTLNIFNYDTVWADIPNRIQDRTSNP